jgi:hypothetical protein
MNFSEMLTALDTKAGRVHTIEDWRRVSEKSQNTPEALTPDDITILGYFGGEESAQRAQQRRADVITADGARASSRVTAPLVTSAKTKGAPQAEGAPPETMDQFLARYGHHKVTFAAMHEWLDVIREGMNKKNIERNARIDALEKEVAALKARPIQKWAGTHIKGAPYAEASLVTRQGSLWVSTCATATTPGVEGSDWRLIVKRGGV